MNPREIEELEALLAKAGLPWRRADWSVDDGPNRFVIEREEPDPRAAVGHTSVWPDGIRKIRIADLEQSDDPDAYGDLIVAASLRARGM